MQEDAFDEVADGSIDPAKGTGASRMKTFFDWSAYEDAGMGDAYADIPRHGGDFAKAVAVCIDSRQCERRGKGVMCPSYRVTGNPNLSTGGRVRLLTAALNADLITQPLADSDLAEAMDLCVACKGCKRECENNVDMALIKAEYLAQRHAGRRPGLRARLFAHLPRWQHRHPWLAALARRRNRWPWLARLAERWLGIAARVPLPENAEAPWREPVGEPGPAADPQRPEVVLLVDCFARHYEPEIAEAALEVLDACGYRVHFLAPDTADPEPGRPLCCGRTYLAQGMVAEARVEVSRLGSALAPHLKARRVLVGLEPSCLLGLRDDIQALGLGPVAREIADHALLLEEFLAREVAARRLSLPIDEPAEALVKADLLVHGHCHQKAVGAMKSMRRLMKLLPGRGFSFVEAGCCGMAGTFGLEAEHAALSVAMAEDGLLPALRAAPRAELVANGFSCRQQIRAHTGRRVRHLAPVLRDALVGLGNGR